MFSEVMEKRYVVLNKTRMFEPQTVVRYVTCTYSGKCFLCEEVADFPKREWIMWYDLQLQSPCQK